MSHRKRKKEKKIETIASYIQNPYYIARWSRYNNLALTDNSARKRKSVFFILIKRIKETVLGVYLFNISII